MSPYSVAMVFPAAACPSLGGAFLKSADARSICIDFNSCQFILMCLHAFPGSVARATKTSLQFDCRTAFNTLVDFKYASISFYVAFSYYAELSYPIFADCISEFECSSYALGANWTYLCPPGCASLASSAPIFGCSAQNLYDISSSVCVAALHQVRREDTEAATDCMRLYSIKICVISIVLPQGYITNTAGGLIQISSVSRTLGSQLCSSPANGLVPNRLQYDYAIAAVDESTRSFPTSTIHTH